MTIDKDALKATFEMELVLKDGGYVKATVEAVYTPGGENDNFVVLGDDYERPLRVGFYDEPMSEGFEPTLYMAVGEIEYGEDISRTTFIGLLAASELCDGQPHDIAECFAESKLAIMMYAIEDYVTRYVVDGDIIIEKKGENDYRISVSAGKAVDEEGEAPDQSFEMYWNGSFKDINISRPVYNQIEYNGEVIPIRSAVVNRAGNLGYVYLCPSEGITTVAAAKEDNPLIITVSASKVFSNVGLSTDRDNFSISYDGHLWDKETLDTCSYIVDSYDEDAGMIHWRLENFSLVGGDKTKLRIEYKGLVTVLDTLIPSAK